MQRCVVLTSLATWARQTCGFKFVGGMELEPATLSSCSLGYMVLDVGGRAVLWRHTIR